MVVDSGGSVGELRLSRIDSSPSDISISVRADSSKSSISFLIFRTSTSTNLLCGSLIHVINRCFQRHFVTELPESSDHTDSAIREVGLATEGLPSVDI